LESAKLIESRKLERLKSDAIRLEKLGVENKQISDSYSKVFKNFAKEKKEKELEAYHDTKKTMILAALGQKKRDIDRFIHTFDAQFEAKKNGLKDMQDTYRDANRDYNIAKKLYDDQQTNYEVLRDNQRRTETAIKELRSLKARIDSEDAKNIGRIYFLNQELKRVLEEMKIKTSKRLTSELAKTWVSVETAREKSVRKRRLWKKRKPIWNRIKGVWMYSKKIVGKTFYAISKTTESLSKIKFWQLSRRRRSTTHEFA
jgi:hypothetical protein